MNSQIAVLIAVMLAAPAPVVWADESPERASGRTAAVVMAPVECPIAGIRFPVPQGFNFIAPTASLRPGETTDLARAVRRTSDGSAMTLRLVVRRIDPEDSVETVAKRAEAEATGASRVSKLKVLTQTTIPIAGVTGLAKLYRFSYKGVAYTAIRTYFIRNVAKPRLRLCYTLTVAAAAEERARLTRILKPMAQATRFVELQHPDSVPVTALAALYRDTRRAYTLMLPLGWHMVPKADGVEFRATDYLGDGRPVYLGHVRVASIGPDVSAREAMKGLFDQFKADSLRKEKLSTSKVSTDDEKMSGMDACQIVARQAGRAAAIAPAGAPAKNPPARVVVLRTVCALAKGSPGNPTPQRNVYLLVVSLPGKDLAAARARMKLLAAGFNVIPPEAAKPVKAVIPKVDLPEPPVVEKPEPVNPQPATAPAKPRPKTPNTADGGITIPEL